MPKITMLGLALAAFALSVAVPAASAEATPSPFQQVRDGVPAEDVECSGNRILMQSPSGKPTCAFAESADALERRGFALLSEALRDDLSSTQPALEKTEETGTITLPDNENPDAGVITYTIAGGDITSIMLGSSGMPWASGALVISINATYDGYAILTIPRTVADFNRAGGGDDMYFVLVDGDEVNYKESKTDYARTLTVDFVAGSEEIKVIG